MRYGFKVFQMQVEDELLWFAESTDLKYCAGQGKTCDEAVKQLEANEVMWLEMAKEDGADIPEPSVEKPIEYSGNFSVRITKTLHQRASEKAKQEGVSLNAFVSEAIAEKVGGLSEKDSQILQEMAVAVKDIHEASAWKSSFNHFADAYVNASLGRITVNGVDKKCN